MPLHDFMGKIKLPPQKKKKKNDDQRLFKVLHYKTFTYI